MRIGMAAYCAMLGGGGVYYYIRNLLSAMVEVDQDAGFTLWFGFLRGQGLEPTDFDLPRVDYRVTRFPKKLLTRMWKHLGAPSAERLAGDVDLLHGTHFELPPSTKIPLVLTVHDVIALKRPDFFPDAKTTKYNTAFLLPDSLRRADRIITVSEHTRRDLVEFFPFVEDRVRVIRHGRPEGISRIDDPATINAMKKNYGVKGPYVLYPVGSIGPRKNLERTLGAFAAFKRDFPEHELVLSGVGGFPDSLKELAKKLEVSHSVKLVRYEAESDYAAMLSGATFVVYPSLYEGFGMPVVEAFAAGAPVIASNVTSVPEVAGDAAVLVDPEDSDAMAEAMTRFAGSDELRAEYSQKALRRAEDFSWKRAARETLDIYRELIRA